jgi:hypothetical protein
MKSWLIAAFAAGALSLGLDDQAAAQGCGPSNPNCIVPTRPVGDSTNAAASTAFVTGGARQADQVGLVLRHRAVHPALPEGPAISKSI